jgi:beta-glucosidase
MKLEEKVGQLCLINGQDNLTREWKRQHAGAVIQIYGADTQPVYDLVPTTRLQIPVLFGLDAIHGNGFYRGATVYPTELTIAAAWNPDIIEEIGVATAEELHHTGVHWAYSPVFCIAREPRWGRVGETYGEDPFLIGEFGSRLIKGLQSKGIRACPKHYAGYSDTQGGRDTGEADLSVRKLRSFYLPPFRKAVEAGAQTIMSSYQATDGVPSSISKFLLQDTLRTEWGFQGLVVTDWNGVGDMVTRQQIFATYEEASAAAIEAGVDIVMVCPEFYQAAINAVTSGLLSEEVLNRAVSRVLKFKFELGLFEDPRPPQLDKVVVGTPEHRALALRAAQESLILLKNDGYLPVTTSKIKKIAVLGPNADHAQAQLGDWVLGSGQVYPLGYPDMVQPPENTTTVLDGITAAFPGVGVVYEAGAVIEPTDKANLQNAITAASSADLVICVIGDRMIYIGENKSTATLEPQGTQLQLLQSIANVKKPFIIDLIASKPLILPQSIIDAASAIIAQFSPGNLGGKAFAQAITGDINPSGKLTISIPRHVGQIPVFYNIIRGQHGDSYADLTFSPQWAFGHGLSYSKFVYSGAILDKSVYRATDELTVTLSVKNQGPYDGSEVIQIYIYDLVTSGTWPVQELKAYKKVFLQGGETQKVVIKLKASELSVVTPAGVRVVEPGDFELRVAQASDKILYKFPFRIQ